MTEIHDQLREGVRPLVFPRSVAVVGASERNARPLAAPRGDAPVFAVNPNRTEVAGEPCYPTVAALPEVPEVALLLVGHGRVEAAAADALAAGVRSLVVPGLGAEAGAEGPPIAARLARSAEASGSAFVGPNCMGVARPEGPSTWTGTVPATFLPGRVAVIAQSGSIAEAFLSCGPRVGFRCVVSCGGEASRDAADLLAFLAGDEETAAVGLFLETVRRPAAFARALELCAEAGKPVVCLKVGRSEGAARATLAHTGAVVGSARAFSGVLRRFGAIEVDDFHDLLETLEVLGSPRRIRGRRIGAISESGGECALLADRGEAVGLTFELLPEELAEALTAEFPNYLTPQNPLDAWAIADADVVFPRSLELMAASGAYDILVAQVDLSRFRGQDEGGWCSMIVEALADAVEGTAVFPAVTSVHATDPPASIDELARARDVPLLRGTEHGLRALAVAARRRPAPARESTRAPVHLADVLRPGSLSEQESTTCLERYGVPFAPRLRVATAEEAALAAAALGPPSRGQGRRAGAQGGRRRSRPRYREPGGRRGSLRPDRRPRPRGKAGGARYRGLLWANAGSGLRPDPGRRPRRCGRRGSGPRGRLPRARRPRPRARPRL